MPRRDMGSIWVLLADLYRELNWLFRVCFFGGLAAGLALGIYLVSGIPRSELRFGLLRGVQWFVLALAAGGGLLGLGVAALIELVIGDDGKGKKGRKQ